jgi:hypothetical protein
MWRGAAILAQTLGMLVATPASAAEQVTLTLPTRAWSEAMPARAPSEWTLILRALEQRLEDLRCLIPDGRVYGSLRRPGAEICIHPDAGLSLCATAQVSWSGNGSSAAIELSNRPSLCPRSGD